ncbi:MAG: ABC-2 transporter permease [Clostridia bacterium]|nr:ABC-2 transporter permease [Clostridia bacterium]
MKSVLLKQFLSLTRPVPLAIVICYLLYPVFISFQTSREGVTLNATMLMGLMLAMIGSILSLSVLTSDNNNGWDKFMATTPVSRKQIIRGKYLFSLAAEFICVLSATIPSVALMVMTTGFNFKEWLFIFSVLLGLAVCIFALVAPITVRFGHMAGLVTFIVVYMTILVGGVIISATMGKNEAGISMLLDMIKTDKYVISAVFVGVSITVAVISMMISEAVYMKKEF